MKTYVVGLQVLLAATLLLSTGGARAVNIELVRVGDPGNAADYTGYGAVAAPYMIGKYEVTAGQYAAFLNAVAKTDTYGLYNTLMWNSPYGCKIQQTGRPGAYTYGVASNYANRPANYVSWGDAARFANWLHNDQPGLITPVLQDSNSTENGVYCLNGATTDAELLAVNRKAGWKWAISSEDEWYKAAYFKGGSNNTGYWEYPTSSNAAPNIVCCDDFTDSGNSANWNNNSTGYPYGGPYFLTKVGEFEKSASPYGTFDQGGNVWEWNESCNFGSYRGIRGGAFVFSGSANFLASSLRSYCIPTGDGNEMGFRVVSADVPEPGSAAMLAGIALMALLHGRRRRAQ